MNSLHFRKSSQAKSLASSGQGRALRSAYHLPWKPPPKPFDFAAAGSPRKGGFLLLKHPRFREVINSPLPTLVASVNGVQWRLFPVEKARASDCSLTEVYRKSRKGYAVKKRPDMNWRLC
jgi:hypothetical protein